jgi:hypothetical protein
MQPNQTTATSLQSAVGMASVLRWVGKQSDAATGRDGRALRAARWESSDVPDGVVCGCVADRAVHLSSLVAKKREPGRAVGWEETITGPGTPFRCKAKQDRQAAQRLPGPCSRRSNQEGIAEQHCREALRSRVPDGVFQDRSLFLLSPSYEILPVASPFGPFRHVVQR